MKKSAFEKWTKKFPILEQVVRDLQTYYYITWETPGYDNVDAVLAAVNSFNVVRVSERQLNYEMRYECDDRSDRERGSEVFRYEFDTLYIAYEENFYEKFTSDCKTVRSFFSKKPNYIILVSVIKNYCVDTWNSIRWVEYEVIHIKIISF